MPLRRWMKKLSHAWFSMQVSHRGRYSIERLLALDEYNQRASWPRVILVCLGTPLPMIVFVISQEFIPLQSPSDGWNANYGFWVRAAILSGVIGYTVLVQAKYLIKGVVMSSLQIALIVFGLMTGYTAICLAVAAYVVFPIPFMTISMTLPFFALVAASFRFVVGKQGFMKVFAHPDQLFGFLLFITAQTLMSVIYPAYQVLFDAAVHTRYELPVVLLLPFIKFITKNIVSVSIGHLEDMIPEGVIFTVDFFNAVYAATSMQSASSLTTVMLIIFIDLSHTVLALRSLYQNTAKIQERLSQINGGVKLRLMLIEVGYSLCQDPQKYENQERSEIQLHSCLPHMLSPSGVNLLTTLDKYPRKHPSKPLILEYGGFSRRRVSSMQVTNIVYLRAKAPQLATWKLGDHHSATIHAVRSMSSISVKPAHQENTFGSGAQQPAEHSRILQKTLEILFTSECLVLTEYLESFIPIFYANFVCVMVQLPNAQYHTELNGLTQDNVGSTVQTVFVYALLEFASFLLLLVMIKRNCGMRALYQLAFVLETQMTLVQSKLMTWMMLTLASRVVHYGVDFAFKFAWIRGSKE